MSFLVVFKRIYSSHCINFCYLCCVFKVIQSLSHSKLSSFTSTGSVFLKDFFNPNQVLFQWEWPFQRKWSLLCAYSPHFRWGSFNSLCWRAFTGLMNLIEIGSRTQKYKFSFLFVWITWNGKTASLDFLGLHTPFHTLCELSLFRRDCWTLGSFKEEGRRFSSLIDCKERKVNRIHWEFVSPF